MRDGDHSLPPERRIEGQNQNQKTGRDGTFFPDQMWWSELTATPPRCDDRIATGAERVSLLTGNKKTTRKPKSFAPGGGRVGDGWAFRVLRATRRELGLNVNGLEAQRNPWRRQVWIVGFVAVLLACAALHVLSLSPKRQNLLLQIPTANTATSTHDPLHRRGSLIDYYDGELQRMRELQIHQAWNTYRASFNRVNHCMTCAGPQGLHGDITSTDQAVRAHWHEQKILRQPLLRQPPSSAFLGTKSEAETRSASKDPPVYPEDPFTTTSPLGQLGQQGSCVGWQAGDPSTSGFALWSETLREENYHYGDVHVEVDTILDEDVYLKGRIIVRPGARLVVLDGATLTLWTFGMHIYGSFIVGTEECPFTGKFEIELMTGTRHPNWGLAAIHVDTGGGLELHGAYPTPWAKLSVSAPQGTQRLYTTPVTGWQVGDDVLVVTTDFDPLQTEMSSISWIKYESGYTSMDVSDTLRYPHFGGYTVEGIDEMAEIANLERPIIIRAANQDAGAHTVATEGIAKYQVSGVRLEHMGMEVLGSYPLHLHLVGQAPAGTHIKGCVILHSKLRAVTVHATQNLLVKDNVAFNISGHAYFLEDGSEYENEIIHNLGVYIKAKDGGDREGSDSQAGISTFWITNVNNDFRDNVAAGSDATGFWIHTRLGVRGPSRSIARYNNLQPFKQHLRDFSGNTAHSIRSCMELESDNNDNLDDPSKEPFGVATPLNWDPYLVDNLEQKRNIPNPDMTTLSRFSCWRAFGNKITGLGGIWIRTTGLILDEFTIADTHEGLHMGSTGGHVNGYMLNRFINSKVVGRTSNRGFDMGADSLVQKWNAGSDETGGGWTLPILVANMGVTGVRIYDGPTAIRNTTFVNFDFDLGETGIPTSPIAGRMSNMFQLSTSSSLEDITFISCIRRVTVIDRKGDGGLTFNLRDIDGSVTGAIDGTILPDFEFYTTGACLRSPLYMVGSLSALCFSPFHTRMMDFIVCICYVVELNSILVFFFPSPPPPS